VAAQDSLKSALVLGGGSEIAAAVVAEAGRRGLQKVVLAARRPDEALENFRSIAPSMEAVAIEWDALDIDSHSPMIERAFAELGAIDLVVCGVGMLGHHAGLSMRPDEVDLMVRTNFSGPAAALTEMAPRMQAHGHGTIVVLSSVAAIRARKSNYAYGSSKAGLDAFAQGLGDALHNSGVRVLVVRPGFVTTRMTEGLDPAPFHTDAAAVAKRTMDAVQAGKHTVMAPGVLTPLFAVLRNAPKWLWRLIAGER
jgi:decaprenylphospho-beta-D-erythro-pentofuranosid-2-ulose 2-reductase